MAHIPSNIGNGDNDAPSAFVLTVEIGFREDRIVEISCVRAIDGHQGDGAQIFAFFQFGGFCALRLCQGLGREFDREAVRVYGDQTYRFRIFFIADTFDHARFLIATGTERLSHDIFAWLGAPLVVRFNGIGVFLSSVGGAQDTLAAIVPFEDAEQLGHVRA